ncbi:hypothetical protein [Emcibacter sp.]|uniref:hypothetical protein n=1 Tax=Emcibacter sp. TaxID=1979954 RepID=UPI002AA844F9|nr:hypothetical protein [Emcibacter sp.]
MTYYTTITPDSDGVDIAIVPITSPGGGVVKIFPEDLMIIEAMGYSMNWHESVCKYRYVRTKKLGGNNEIVTVARLILSAEYLGGRIKHIDGNNHNLRRDNIIHIPSKWHRAMKTANQDQEKQ